MVKNNYPRRQSADFFLSHSHADAAQAEALANWLKEQEKLTPWLDNADIGLGALLRNELQEAIRRSRLLVLLWSRAAARSRWGAAEILTAFRLDRLLEAAEFFTRWANALGEEQHLDYSAATDDLTLILYFGGKQADASLPTPDTG